MVLPERLEPTGRRRASTRSPEEHFAPLAALEPEVVLLGTGSRLRFPHPELTAPLAAARASASR